MTRQIDDPDVQFDPSDPAQADARYGFWADARNVQPVLYSPKDDVRLVTGYEDMSRVSRDHAHFSTNSVFALGRVSPESVKAILNESYSWHYFLSSNDLPEPTPLEKAMSQALSGSQTRALTENVRVNASKVIDGSAADEGADLAARVAYPFPALVVVESLGFPSGGMEQLKNGAIPGLGCARIPARNPRFGRRPATSSTSRDMSLRSWVIRSDSPGTTCSATSYVSSLTIPAPTPGAR